MDTITEWVQNKRQISANDWISAAEKLNVLLSFEHDKMVELEHELNVLRNIVLEGEKKSVAAMEIKIKADPKYVEFRKQELFIKRIDQAIMLSKHHARLVSFT